MKFPKFDAILRGPISSVLGLLIMGAAGFTMVKGVLNPWPEGAIVFALGFALLFMKDALPGFITKFFNKKIKE